jgi:hypothetical protein
MLDDYQTFKQMYDDIDSLRVLKEDAIGTTIEIWYNATIGKFHYVLYRNYEIPEYKLSGKLSYKDLLVDLDELIPSCQFNVCLSFWL